jgi:outer membrane protein TolC
MKKLQSILMLQFVALNLLFQVAGVAQSARSFNPLKDEISDMLPPLNVLLDSAYNHDPALKAGNFQVQIGVTSLKTSRAQWTRDLGLQANAGYGTFDYVYNNSGTGAVNQSYISRQNQYQYQVGGYLYLPLYTLANRRNEVRQAKLQIEQSRSELASQHNELQKQVIRQYNDMIARQRLLKIKSTYLETCKINMHVAEKSFLNGTITIDEYSRVSEIESRTESEYEIARMDFLTAYMTLEVMVGMKFNLSTEIPIKNEGK